MANPTDQIDCVLLTLYVALVFMLHASFDFDVPL